MAVKGTNDLGNGKLVVVVDHDPASVATDALAGSIIVREGTIQTFLKLDDGSTTNVTRIMEVATHLAEVAPANVTKAAAASGAALTSARADHKHDVSTAASGTIAVGDAAAEGAATSLARSDHAHALPAPAAPANVTKAAASAGAATTVARADHKHDVTTAVPVDVGSANAEGVATSLARADHVHNLPLSVLASLLNASITEATGDITTTSATDVVATGMSATPAAGTYLVWFGSSMQSSNGAAIMHTSIYSGGTQVAASQRTTDAPGTNEATSFMTMALVTVNGAQAIDGRWRTSAGTATMHERQLALVRVA